MSSTKTFKNKNVIPDTHFFVYQNKKYPIKYDFFKYSSKYFEKNHDTIEKSKFLPLVDNETENKIVLTEETINNFINFVQGSEITVNNDNIFGLNYLSNKYEVTSLNEILIEYFEQHPELVIEAISNQIYNNIFNSEKYEHLICKNLSNYIDNEKLLELDIPVIYRILQNNKNNENDNQTSVHEKIKFLYKCLDKYGKNASILFNCIDFGQEIDNVVKNLHQKYSTVFDFDVINVPTTDKNSSSDFELKKQLIEQTSKINLLKEEISKSQEREKEMEQKIKILEQKIESICNNKNDSNDSNYIQNNYPILDGMIEIIYPSENFQSLIDKIADTKTKSGQIPSKISLTINDKDFFKKDYKINDFVYSCKVSCLEKIDKSTFSIFPNLSILKIIGTNDVVFDSNSLSNKQLTKIKFGPTIRIEYYAFLNCALLTKITFPSSLLYIGNNSFKGCTQLKQITIDPYSTQICENTFQDCSSLTDLIISTNGKYEEKYEHDKKEEDQFILFRKTGINRHIFNKMNWIKQESIIHLIKSTIYRYNNDDFNHFYDFVIFLLNEKEKYRKRTANPFGRFGCGIRNPIITDQLFCIECNSSKNIMILDFYIVKYLFENGTLNSSEFTSVLKFFDTIYVPISSAEYYFNDKNYEEATKLYNLCKSKVKLQANIENIENIDNLQNKKEVCTIKFDSKITNISSKNSISPFEGCTLLEEIVISQSATTIGKHIFCNCSSITKMIIPSSVTAINECALMHCSSLKEISFVSPSSLTTIGDYAFAGCSSLIQIAIPKAVTCIGKWAFYQCESLEHVQLEPYSLLSIEEGTFCECKSLVQISIPFSVYSINDSAFNGCSKLTQISIPQMVKSIGNYAFYNCSLLTQITFPSSLISIGDYAFSKCTKIEHFIIPISVAYIRSHTFDGCSSLIDISIPFNAKSIGRYSFHRCSSLVNVFLANSLQSIEEFAFSDCLKLNNMEIPPKIKKVEAYAFVRCPFHYVENKKKEEEEIEMAGGFDDLFG